MIVKWIVVAWIMLGTVATIAAVGKARQPTTAGVAAAVTLINAALITAIVIWWR